MAAIYVDDRLTTGANDGSTPSDAFQSIRDLLSDIVVIFMALQPNSQLKANTSKSMR